MINLISRLRCVFLRYFLSHEDFARRLGVKIGVNCSIATRNWGSEPYLIEIGDNVQITDNVSFYTHGGAWVLRNKYPNFDYFGKIRICDNVYVGSGTAIMPGVTINSNVIVGAKSVVTKSVPSNVVIAGNPARVICSLNDFETKMLPFNVGTYGLSQLLKMQIILNLGESQFISK